MGKGGYGCCIYSVFRCLIIGDHSRALLDVAYTPTFENCISVGLMLGGGVFSILLWKVVEC